MRYVMLCCGAVRHRSAAPHRVAKQHVRCERTLIVLRGTNYR